jgi:hypothetical protein
MRLLSPRFSAVLVAFVLITSCAIVQAGNRLLADDEDGVVKSKVRLELVGRLQRKPGGAVGGMTLHGKYVYLVNEAGLQIVDVSNPAIPKVTGSYRPKNYLGPVAVSGTRAYVIEKETLLRVLDVSNPAQPRAVGSRQMPDTVRGLAVSGKRVYASLSESLRILDMSDPSQPKEIGVCGGLQLAGRVTVAGKYAYVAADFHGMRIIDVSNPGKPTEIGAFTGPGNVTKIAVQGQHAYVADYAGGLHIADTSNPKKPVRIARHGDFVVGDVAVAGKYALLAAGALDVLDVSSPNNPRQVAGYSGKDHDAAWSLAVAGEYVYTISDAGLFVFRLTSR